MARRRAGLTQEALARRAATSQSALSAYESGRRSPSVATLTRILEAAGFELRMRLSEPDTTPPGVSRRDSCHPTNSTPSPEPNRVSALELDAPRPSVPDLDIAGVVRALNAHRVRYVVIGGVAALVHTFRSPPPGRELGPIRHPPSHDQIRPSRHRLGARRQNRKAWPPPRPTNRPRELSGICPAGATVMGQLKHWVVKTPPHMTSDGCTVTATRQEP